MFTQYYRATGVFILGNFCLAGTPPTPPKTHEVFYLGTKAGASVFGGGVTKKYVPNFAWGDKDKYKFDEFIKTAKIVMGRRGVEMGGLEIERMQRVFGLAA